MQSGILEAKTMYSCLYNLGKLPPRNNLSLHTNTCEVNRNIYILLAMCACTVCLVITVLAKWGWSIPLQKVSHDYFFDQSIQNQIPKWGIKELVVEITKSVPAMSLTILSLL